MVIKFINSNFSHFWITMQKYISYRKTVCLHACRESANTTIPSLQNFQNYTCFSGRCLNFWTLQYTDHIYVVCWQCTAVVTYRETSERPLSCSLQSLEVFSCSLAAEAETALSIIDPMSLTVELNNSPAEHERKLGTVSTGLLDVAIADKRLPILEVKELIQQHSW